MSLSKELYDYLVKPDNLETANEIYTVFKDVTHQLVQEFWTAVEHQLKQKIADTEWQFYGSAKLEDGHKVGLQLGEYTDLLITYDWLDKNCFYGFFVIKGKIDREKIDEITKDINKYLSEKPNDWLISWDRADDFRNIRTWKSISPETRDSKVQEYVERIFQLAENLKPYILSYQNQQFS